MNPEISVVICTHNPRRDYLDQVLEALRGQSFPTERWELLLIDNKSAEPLADRVDLGWHPAGRVVREEELGLTQARVRGIRESRGDLVVFVDDDNLLATDYLEVAQSISCRHTNLGAWSGQVLPEFEVSPSTEIEPFLGVLCIRILTSDYWGNHCDTGKLPFGAGMVVRKSVATAYASSVANNPKRLALDRSGQSLASSGDLDLALTSVDLGMGTGLFSNLKLSHLIGENRLQRPYILKLIEDSVFGHEIFKSARGISDKVNSSRLDRLVARYKSWRGTPMQRAVDAARTRGLKRASQALIVP
jgi:glycosyltransferase involved in cell wall biosynthesis